MKRGATKMLGLYVSSLNQCIHSKDANDSQFIISAAGERFKRRIFVKRICVSLAALFFVIPAHADFNWNGENGAGNMSYSNNWYFNSVPSFNSGSSLQFSNNDTQETSIYDDFGG